jgi:hypothetical protein
MSELEREFELEMEGDEGESTTDEELESDWEAESESDEETDEESDEEWEREPTERSDYAQRFYELSQREFESESELDDEVRGLVNEMEREYFWGLGRLKKIGRRLLKKGVGQLAGRLSGFKGLQAITRAARQALNGNLSSLARMGFNAALSAHPAGAAALPALKAMGFEATEDPERNRESWDNYVEVAREAFDHLGRNFDERAVSPLEASRLASAALQTGLRKVQAQMTSAGGGRPSSYRRRRVIRARKGDKIVILVD